MVLKVSMLDLCLWRLQIMLMAHPTFVLALFLLCIQQIHGAVQTQVLHLLFEHQTNGCLLLMFTVLGI